MGIPTVKEATRSLALLGLNAAIGNPGEVMPHVTRVLVAVSLHQATVDSQTLVASVCGPQSMGWEACHSVAALVSLNWGRLGAKCRWGDYSFDSKAAIHILKVYAQWDNETDTSS